MTDLLKILFIASLGLLLLNSCEQRPSDGDNIILAELGNEVLLLRDVKNNVSEERYHGDSLQVIDRYRNNWIKKQLKVNEARRLGLHNQEEVQRRIRQAEESILVDAYNEAVHLEQSGDPVSRTEAQSYYESNKEKFVLAEQHVRFRHMMSSTLNNAQNARNALQQGRSWRDVAEQYSANPRQAIRGAQQYFPISTAAIEYGPLNNFLQVIGVTEISPIRRIGDHYHFVQLMESRDIGDHPNMEWIIDQIAEWLTIDRKRKHLRSMEQSLFLQAQANNELRIFDVRVPEQEIEIVTDSL